MADKPANLNNQNPLKLTTDFLGEDRHEFVAKLAYQLWGKKGATHRIAGSRLVRRGASGVRFVAGVKLDYPISERGTGLLNKDLFVEVTTYGS